MATFRMAPQTEIAKIMMKLGYSGAPNGFYPSTEMRWFLQSSQPVFDQVDSLIVQLDDIDATIGQASKDSMALQVGELKVDYIRHISILKSEANRLLLELSQLTGFPILYNKYTGSGLRKQVGVSRMAIKAYF